MSRLVIVCVGLLAVLLGLPAAATEPGTPMDCTDLLLAPGLTCSQFSDPGEGGFFRQNDAVVDNDGRILEQGGGSIRDVLGDLGRCGTSRVLDLGLVFHVGEGGVRTPILSVRGRCLDAATSTVEGLRSASLLFDAVGGTLIVVLSSTCNSRGDLCDGYGGGGWIARIDGLTPLAAALPEPPSPAPQCDNGLDDDGDGAIDLDDKRCKSASDNDESRP